MTTVYIQYEYSMNYGMNIDELVNCTLLCIIVQIRSKSDFRKERFRRGFLLLRPFPSSQTNLSNLLTCHKWSQCARKSLGTIIFMTAVGTWRGKETNDTKRTKSSENRREPQRQTSDLQRPVETCDNGREYKRQIDFGHVQDTQDFVSVVHSEYSVRSSSSSTILRQTRVIN